MRPDFIRARLREWLMIHSEPCPDAVLIDELCVVDKSRRVDLAYANGKLSGFEVKSEADTLARWEGQAVAYLRVFDEVWLCCHSRHVETALARSGRPVGLMVVDDFGNIAVVRQARTNKGVDAFDLTGLLWREELNELAKGAGLSIPSRLRIKDARQVISTEIPLEVIKAEVKFRLKLRYRPKDYSSSPSSSSSVV